MEIFVPKTVFHLTLICQDNCVKCCIVTQEVNFNKTTIIVIKILLVRPKIIIPFLILDIEKKVCFVLS